MLWLLPNLLFSARYKPKASVFSGQDDVRRSVLYIGFKILYVSIILLLWLLTRLWLRHLEDSLLHLFMLRIFWKPHLWIKVLDLDGQAAEVWNVVANLLLVDVKLGLELVDVLLLLLFEAIRLLHICPWFRFHKMFCAKKGILRPFWCLITTFLLIFENFSVVFQYQLFVIVCFGIRLSKLFRRFCVCSFLLELSWPYFIAFCWKLSRFIVNFHFMLVIGRYGQIRSFVQSSFCLQILLCCPCLLCLNRLPQWTRYLWHMCLWYSILTCFPYGVEFISFESLLPIVLWYCVQLSFRHLLYRLLPLIILKWHFQKLNVLFYR